MPIITKKPEDKVPYLKIVPVGATGTCFQPETKRLSRAKVGSLKQKEHYANAFQEAPS